MYVGVCVCVCMCVFEIHNKKYSTNTPHTVQPIVVQLCEYLYSAASQREKEASVIELNRGYWSMPQFTHADTQPAYIRFATIRWCNYPM